MNCALENLNQIYLLVYECLTPEQVCQPEKVKEQQLLALAHAKSLPCQFTQFTTSEVTKKVFTTQVNLTQLTVGILLNRIYQYKTTCPAAFYDELEGLLIAFLQFLQKEFAAYFCSYLSMPEPLWQPEKEKIIKGLETMKNTTGDYPDPALVAILDTEFNSLVQLGSLSFAQTTYWTALINQLPGTDNTDGSMSSCMQTLISYNFNSACFVNYALDKCAPLLDDPSGIALHWSGLLKQINRIPVVPDIALYKNQPLCKSMIIETVTTELFAYDYVKPGAATTDGRQVRYTTKLSVAQLSLFKRLQVDENILVADNITTLLKNVSDDYRTLRTDHISEEKLYNKYYSIDPATVAIMRTHLINMLNRLKHY